MSDLIIRLLLALFTLASAAFIGASRPAQPPAYGDAGMHATGFVSDSASGTGFPSAVSVESAAVLTAVPSQRKETPRSVTGQAHLAAPQPSAKPSERPSLIRAVTTSAGPRPTPRKGPARTVSPKPLRHAVTGVMSWYCSPGRSACTVGHSPSCRCAAAGPALRRALGPSWRGRTVTITAGRASTTLKLVDFCACGGRLLDGYAALWFGLGIPLSRGLVNATVQW